MEVDSSAPIRDGPNPTTAGAERSCQPVQDIDRTRVTKETLQALVEECRRALKLPGECGNEGDDRASLEGPAHDDYSALRPDENTEELPHLLKSSLMCFGCPEKLVPMSAPQNDGAAEGSSWYLVSDNDLWDGSTTDLDGDEYVTVRTEDVAEGVAVYMAAYLSSLQQTKDLTPDQLQKVLNKTFSTKKNKGKLQRAWDGSKVLYNVASWGGTAIGIYQNPIVLNAASKAFCTSYRIISELL